MKQMHIAVLAVLVLAVFGVLYGIQSPGFLSYFSTASHITKNAEGQSIMRTKDGFVPDTITIKKGDTITFSTDTGNMFWPASNLHPSHLLYPEFDPKDPIQPGDSWSFTFEKVGVWQFHDHLAPYFAGTITVTEQ